MQRSNARSGGFFWFLCIAVGLIAGVFLGNAMGGVLIGTIAGGLLALATWAIDRRKRG